MIEHLAVLVDTFPSAANQTRCFVHILNLVVKSILRQFEGLKKEKVGADVTMEIDGDNDNDDDEEEGNSGSNEGGGNECEDVDNDVVDNEEEEEWLDEMSEEELLTVKEKVKPIRLVLTKVSRFNKYKHESTNQQRSRTHGSTASWCLQGYQKFLHNRSSQVVRRPRNTGSQATHHAPRCVHTMELDIRYASIRHRLPCST